MLPSVAYTEVHVYWSAAAAASCRTESTQRERRNNATCQSVRGTRWPPQTEPSGTGPGSTGTVAGRRQSVSHLRQHPCIVHLIKWLYLALALHTSIIV